MSSSLLLRLLPAVLLLAGGCSTARTVWHMPAAATREAPPPGIEEAALALDALAPDLELPGSDGATHRLRGEGPTVLVFYRGFW